MGLANEHMLWLNDTRLCTLPCIEKFTHSVGERVAKLDSEMRKVGWNLNALQDIK
ncbi:hypothetical protein H1R20_g1049, partial [Candolleomyces eurysporus]